MRICVVVSSSEALSSAGARIRYGRLQSPLAEQGHELRIATIDDANVHDHADVYLFSKTYDLQAILLARFLRARGARVGIDVFDDYFSQAEDSRFVHLRRWLADIAGAIDFVLCSTPEMAKRLEQIVPALPCQVINDPIGDFQLDKASGAVAAKAQAALAEKCLRIAWFGIGDNPHFSLGLEDLFAFSDTLTGARRFGYEVRLEVLTNLRALTPKRLDMLARLPVTLSIDEWSEPRESSLIARSLACFLPVNAQPFSVAKSLNRAVSALTGGSQVISVGYPLYDRLSDFVYRDIGALVADLEAGSLRLRRETASQLGAVLNRLGQPRTESQVLLSFLDTIPAPTAVPRPPEGKTAMILHGLLPGSQAHNVATRLGALSVASPQTRRSLPFDVALVPDDGRGDVELMLSSNGLAALRPEFRESTQPSAAAGESQQSFRLRLPRSMLGDPSPVRPVEQSVRRLPEMARYAREIERMRNLLARLFPEPTILHSESSFPYSDAAGFPTRERRPPDVVASDIPTANEKH